MKEPHTLLKLGAVASSLLLVGGLIGYRAGAFHWFTKTTPTVSGDTNQAAPPIMYSSKDGLIVESTTLDSTVAPAAATAGPVLLPGSKSAAILPVIPPASPKPTDSQPRSSSQTSPPSP